MTITERFESEAKARGIAVTMAVARAGVSMSHFYKMKRGEVSPRAATVKRLAEALGVRPQLLDPEMFKGEAVAEASAAHFDASAMPITASDLGLTSEETVFVGMSVATLTTVAPLIEALQADARYVSGPLVNGLNRVARLLKECYQAALPELTETFVSIDLVPKHCYMSTTEQGGLV